MILSGSGRVPKASLVLLQMESRRDSMLETARHCFTSAARCEGDGDEEEWLIHYMLGKVAEKQQQPPAIYLLHYRQAGHYLHEEAARYPKKIHYHNPPELAMEALEVTPCRPGTGKQGRGGPVPLSPLGMGHVVPVTANSVFSSFVCN